MKQFILLYRGSAKLPETKTQEQVNASDSLRLSWIEKIGSALVDMGTSTIEGKAIIDDGSIVPTTDLHGYSIIKAESMDEALKLIDGNPFLMDRTGEFRIEVFELGPVSSA